MSALRKCLRREYEMIDEMIDEDDCGYCVSNCGNNPNCGVCGACLGCNNKKYM